MNKFSKMKVHWLTYNYCLFVSYLGSVTFRYGWISDTKFQKFLDKDWMWTSKNFFGYGSGVEKSISAHLWCTWWEVRNFAWHRILTFDIIYRSDPIQIQQNLLQPASSPIQVQSNARLCNGGGSVFFAMVFIFTKNQNYFVSVSCAAFITINGDSCYFIVNIFRPSGSCKLLLYCWYAALC